MTRNTLQIIALNSAARKRGISASPENSDTLVSLDHYLCSGTDHFLFITTPKSAQTVMRGTRKVEHTR